MKIKPNEILSNYSVLFTRSFRGVVVITSVKHTEGPRFDPGRKHSFFLFDTIDNVYERFKINDVNV